MYAHVALPIPVRQTFVYEVPSDLLTVCRPGTLATVPFGRVTRRGVVVSVDNESALDTSRIKPLSGIVEEEPVLSAHGLELARWMAEYYLCPIGEAVSAQLPGGLSAIGRKSRKSKTTEELELPVPQKLPRPFALTAAQARALQSIRTALEADAFRCFLLHGVTGSGKTQVYLEAAQRARELGGQALLLVPEIALAPGLIREVQRVFGSRVGVLHSHLTEKERRESWLACRRGQVDVVVGARSAVFAPLPDLKLIVVDEEHEPAYKQSEQLRYHGRDVAIMRANLLGIPCVLGSATPSLESWHNVERDKFTLLSLPERIDRRPLPTVEVVDQSSDDEAGNKRRQPALLTPRLATLMEACLSRGEQVVLFLNRRGHARIVECEMCGHTEECPHCELTLTYHSTSERFLCHYCDHAQPAASACAQCSSPLFRMRGSGTQRVEAELAKLFPETVVHRLDSDTARKRGATQEILDAFGEGRGEILLGTQLVAKGHDFAGVTLVGVLNADTALHIPDFRASERTFQLLTQVAGPRRARRAGRPRRVADAASRSPGTARGEPAGLRGVCSLRARAPSRGRLSTLPSPHLVPALRRQRGARHRDRRAPRRVGRGDRAARRLRRRSVHYRVGSSRAGAADDGQTTGPLSLARDVAGPRSPAAAPGRTTAARSRRGGEGSLDRNHPHRRRRSGRVAVAHPRLGRATGCGAMGTPKRGAKC